MTILSDQGIVRYLNDPKTHGLEIEGLKDRDTQIQPASVDLRLGHEFAGIDNGHQALKRRMNFTNGEMSQEAAVDLITIDPHEDLSDSLYHTTEVEEGHAMILPPMTFLLGTTIEKVTIPDTLVGRVEGRSSYARLGVSIHTTAGYVDPGFEGKITLEIFNHSPRPIKLYPGDRVCQIVFERLSAPVDRPYGADRGSKYHGQETVTPSRIDREFTGTSDSEK